MNLAADLDQIEKEVKMLQILHQEYTLNIADFSKWQEKLKYRNTFKGKIAYYFGKLVAIIFISKIALAAKQLIQPVYQEEMLDKTTRQALLYFRFH